MQGHEPTRITHNDKEFVIRCACRMVSPAFDSAWAASDWHFKHTDDIARVRAGKRSMPTLKTMAQRYREAEAAESDPDKKGLWAMLAEGIEQRLEMLRMHQEMLPGFDTMAVVSRTNHRQ